MRKLILFGILGGLLIFAFRIDKNVTSRRHLIEADGMAAALDNGPPHDRDSTADGGPVFGPQMVVTLGGTPLEPIGSQPMNEPLNGASTSNPENTRSSPGSQEKPSSSKRGNKPPVPPKNRTVRRGEHRVIEGENWDSISQVHYQDPHFAHHLAELNQQNPSRPPPIGKTIRIPPSNDLERRYVIRSGDSLSQISERLLGTKRLAKEIARLNNLKDVHSIRVNQVLRLPRPSSQRP